MTICASLELGCKQSSDPDFGVHTLRFGAFATKVLETRPNKPEHAGHAHKLAALLFPIFIQTRHLPVIGQKKCPKTSSWKRILYIAAFARQV